MSKNSGKAAKETQAGAPVDEPGKDAAANGAGAPKAKPKRTLRHRGQECEITKTTRRTRTGAIYDHFLYKRNVTNRKDGSVSIALVGKSQRRPGTGVVGEPTEVEIEE